MKLILVFFAGMIAPYALWYLVALINDYIYIPFIWAPWFNRQWKKIDQRNAEREKARG